MQTDDKRITDLEHKVTVLTRLSEISAVLNSTLKIKALLNQIMEAAVRDCRFGSGFGAALGSQDQRSALRGDDDRRRRSSA